MTEGITDATEQRGLGNMGVHSKTRGIAGGCFLNTFCIERQQKRGKVKRRKGGKKVIVTKKRRGQ